MIPRFAPARFLLVLFLPLLAWAGNACAAEPAVTPGTGTATPDATPVVDDAQAPPMPTLSPSGVSQPLNFYTREQLRRFPSALVPTVPPWCHGAYLVPPLPKLDGDDQGPRSPVYVAADSMQLDDAGESQVAGTVEVRQGQNLMHADRAVITAGRDRVLLSGHVFLQDPAMTIEAESAELTLDGSGSHVVNPQYSLHALHIRGSASEIRRENQYSVTIDNGAYTTCEPGHDAWYLAARRIELDQEEGWGSARSVRLLVHDVPIVYVPYITFPIDKRRRSGVLYPTFSYGDSNGTDIAVPYYFNLAPQYDLLLTPRWIEKRGSLVEGELRYLLGAPHDSFGHGSLGVGWMGKDSAYGDQSRHIVRFQHVGDPTPQWQVLADATRVSDNDYLDDLDTQLSVNRESHLVRVLQGFYAADNWSALARVQGWQTINPTIAATDLPYRRVPQLVGSGAFPGPYGLIWGATSEFVTFDRNIDPLLANPVGSRMRVEPSLRLPLSGSFWRVEPAARARYVAYNLEDGPVTDTPEHLVPTVTLDSTLLFEREFRFRNDGWLQTLEPRAFALWTPYEAQDDAPVFDTTARTFSYQQLFRDNRYAGGDRISDAEQVSLAVESRLFGPDGSEAARFQVGQARYGGDLRTRLLATDPIDTTRKSPLVANAMWRVSRKWSASSEGQWSPATGDFVRGSLRASWQDEEFRTFNAAYRYDDPSIDQSELSGLLPVSANWSLVGRGVFDFTGDRWLEALGGVEFESCCWRARVIARRTLDIVSGSATLVPDQAVVFEVELKGLGSLGDKISTELSRDIPGYENRRKALH